MTFTRAANGRVARHKCNIIQTDGRHQRAMTHAGAGEGRLTTSMTATDDNDHHNYLQYTYLLNSLYLLLILKVYFTYRGKND